MSRRPEGHDLHHRPDAVICHFPRDPTPDLECPGTTDPSIRAPLTPPRSRRAEEGREAPPWRDEHGNRRIAEPHQPEKGRGRHIRKERSLTSRCRGLGQAVERAPKGEKATPTVYGLSTGRAPAGEEHAYFGRTREIIICLAFVFSFLSLAHRKKGAIVLGDGNLQPAQIEDK